MNYHKRKDCKNICNHKKNEGDDAENIDMFKILYKLFRHSFKGIMRYEPSIYVGDVHALFVADDTKHFSR